VPIVLKSGSLSLLEPSGPVQACNGIALPFLQSNTTWLMFILFVDRTTHHSLMAYCAFQLSPPGVSTCVTTQERPVAEGGTVGEKCPVILSK
jgi:hypothetical protein